MKKKLINNTRIIIHGSKATIVGNYDVFKLDKELTFKSPNYWYSPAYRSGRWNGDIKFLKGNTFSIGFLNRVMEIVKNAKIEHHQPMVDIISQAKFFKNTNLM